MGEGLVRAVLATLATRSWSLKLDRRTADGQFIEFYRHEITGPEVVRFYESIVSGEPHPMLLGAHSMSDRRVDRALAVLKKAKLIAFIDRRWRAVTNGDDGDAG